MIGQPPQVGAQGPFGILALIKKFIPFSHRPFRSGAKDGPGQQLTCVFSNANTNTTFTISLGRVPSYYVQVAASVGGVVFNDTSQGANWTPNSIILRATVAGTYGLMVF